MPNPFLSSAKESVKCLNCGYILVKPYPKDQLCPRCRTFLSNLFAYTDPDKSEPEKLQPKQFETKKASLTEKLPGKIRTKSNGSNLQVEKEMILLKGEEEYLKLAGITTKERTQLYCTNEKYKYLLELTNNLDFIATSILGGELDKMSLISIDGIEDKTQFYVKDGIIYLVYGKFPDKKGKWLLEQMANYYAELLSGKDPNGLNEENIKIDKSEIDRKFEARMNFIIKEYLRLQDVFSDQDLPYVEDKLRGDYLGLSSMSIGVISLLVGDELNVEVPGQFENPEEEKEMKESLLTAKIEAIAANTLGNTGAFPRWIAVKLSYQNYRFLTFKKYKNDYFLYMLLEGNLHKLEKVEDFLDYYINPVIETPFAGNLKPFNRLKSTLKEILKQKRTFS